MLKDIEGKDEFMDRLDEADQYFTNMREEARMEQTVLRYVGVFDAKTGKVEAKLAR